MVVQTVIDGYSDPDENGPLPRSRCLLSDGTQWVDGDGDGYGDNALGTNPASVRPAGTSTCRLPDPENPQQNTELPRMDAKTKMAMDGPMLPNPTAWMNSQTSISTSIEMV